jgi:GntR family transcriptional regulator
MLEEYLLPKYYLLKKDLIKKIENDLFKTNEQIPSERELIQMYGYSRITVRKAIDDLVNEGYLYRVHGKGTYVKGNDVQQNIVSLNSITTDILAMGKVPSRKVLKFKVDKTFLKRAEELEIDNNDDVVILDRIYFADKEPINRTTDYLPAKYFPNINNYDFSKNSLFQVIEEEYKIKITRAVRTIEAVLADEEIAGMLELKKGFPVLLFRGVTYGLVEGKEVPIESFKTYYRSDNRKFTITQIKMG